MMARACAPLDWMICMFYMFVYSPGMMTKVLHFYHITHKHVKALKLRLSENLFCPLENSQQTLSLWNIYLITDQTHDSDSHTCRPLTDRSNRAPIHPSRSYMSKLSLGLFCFLFFFLGGGVGGRLLLSVPTEWNRDDVSNSWMGGGREEKAAMQRGVFHSAWKPPSSWGWRGEEGRKGGGGRVIVTPWDSLYPPPTSLILSVTLPPLFLSLSTFSVCRLLLSPLLSSPLLSSPPLSHPSLSHLSHPLCPLSLCIRGSCPSVSDWTCLIKMKR